MSIMMMTTMSKSLKVNVNGCRYHYEYDYPIHCQYHYEYDYALTISMSKVIL